MPFKPSRIDPLYVFIGLVFSVILVASMYFYSTRHDDAFEIKTQLYDLSGACSLSLCDCRCYLTEELPEIIETKVCGNDCYGRLGIDGCILVNDSCQLVLKK
jgi:hypothetical protein